MTRKLASKLVTKSRRSRRSGFMMAAVLCCLVACALLLGMMLRQTSVLHRQISRQRNETQVRWLLEAGLERAAFQLDADPAYGGETWTVPTSVIGGRATAEVVISIDSSLPNNVSIVATYPQGGRYSRQQTARFRVQVEPFNDSTDIEE